MRLYELVKTDGRRVIFNDLGLLYKDLLSRQAYNDVIDEECIVYSLRENGSFEACDELKFLINYDTTEARPVVNCKNDLDQMVLRLLRGL